MKNPVFRKVHKRKEPTTNYPRDGHKAFCERCYIAHREFDNNICPCTGSQRKSSACSL